MTSAPRRETPRSWVRITGIENSTPRRTRDLGALKIASAEMFRGYIDCRPSLRGLIFLNALHHRFSASARRTSLKSRSCIFHRLDRMLCEIPSREPNTNHVRCNTSRLRRGSVYSRASSASSPPRPARTLESRSARHSRASGLREECTRRGFRARPARIRVELRRSAAKSTVGRRTSEASSDGGDHVRLDGVHDGRGHALAVRRSSRDSRWSRGLKIGAGVVCSAVSRPSRRSRTSDPRAGSARPSAPFSMPFARIRFPRSRATRAFAARRLGSRRRTTSPPTRTRPPRPRRPRPGTSTRSRSKSWTSPSSSASSPTITTCSRRPSSTSRRRRRTRASISSAAATAARPRTPRALTRTS